MLKMDILSRRRPDMTHEQYVDYWTTKHGQLFSSQPDVKRYVRRYIQSRIVDNPPAGFKIGQTDGLVQLWFDDLAGLKAFFASDGYKNVIQADELRFTDPNTCEFFFSNEVPIIG